MFRATEVDCDYHRGMNRKVFMNWFENNLLPALSQNSIVVLDNASYHNLKVEGTKSPTTATKKVDIQQWLCKQGVNFTQKVLKAELLELVKQNRPAVRYQTDEILARHGHKVLRTPVRHCELITQSSCYGPK